VTQGCLLGSVARSFDCACGPAVRELRSEAVFETVEVEVEARQLEVLLNPNEQGSARDRGADPIRG